MATVCIAATGCVCLADVAANRASREFACPPEQVGVLERSDISTSVYDLEACGHRARYSCLVSNSLPATCVREPDPPKWDPDPKAIASLPRPPSSGLVTRSSKGEYRRICANREDFDMSLDCVLR